MIDQWKIRVSGYGTFNFEGTEQQAEEMCRTKATWERGHGMKWRVTNQTKYDDIASQVADLWDQGEGVPYEMMRALQKAAAPQS